MKLPAIALCTLTAGFFLPSVRLHGQTADPSIEGTDRVEYQLILPEEKTPESIKPNEANPFSKNAQTGEDESSSEENAVRDALLGLPITGISTDAQGNRRLMLGPLKLERGMIVPPILPDQAVHLRVNAITEQAVELVWIEKKNTGLPPRALIIPFNVKPTIRHRLPIMAGGNGAQGGLPRVGTINPNLPAPSTPAANPPGNEGAASGGGQSPVIPSNTPPSAPDAGDPNHPANMLMNLLLNKSLPTQQNSAQK